MPIILEIVTPDSVVFSEEVEHVVVPTVNGKIDLLQRHIPIIDRIMPGDIKIKSKKEEKILAVGSGFVESYGNKVSIITDQAMDVSNEDEQVIDEAVARAKASLEEGKKSNMDQAQIELLEAAARFEMAKKIARKKSG
ncbi:MAG: ATP synthase F1 subunit epsilon [Opitutales bacterium]|nr:ATP synthase F1 subunit epsilon [Opitutales bacterium]